VVWCVVYGLCWLIGIYLYKDQEKAAYMYVVCHAYPVNCDGTECVADTVSFDL